jgi:asparagine synthase (glutamine-hydrolysing)
MCGIAGIIDYEGRYPAARLQHLTRVMRDALAHRGPDDAGLWASADGRVCLGHRRLAVLDLRPEGRQPMLNEDGRVAVTFNGEIYNFQALRRTLQAAGHRFASRTDTEVLCHLFEDRSPSEVVAALNGMFAFAVWRDSRRELVLARDPFGKKPLYYLRRGAFLAFASELRPLALLGPELTGDIDPDAVQAYLLLQYVPAPRTIWRHVRKLEPGTFLHLGFEPGRVRFEKQTRFFRFEASEPQRTEDRGQRTEDSRADLAEGLRVRLIEAVRDRLVADVPVGAFLSGGNDSSLVVAVMAHELGVRARTFSVGFRGWPASEHVAARQIARHLGAEHHELLVDPSALDLLPEVVAALDEPNGDSSCLPVYLLCRFARQQVTVALSGDGGDELFGGYGRHTETVAESASLRRRLGWLRRHRRWWSASRAYVGDRLLPMTEALLRTLADVRPEAARLLREMRAVADGRGPVLHRLRTLDAATYLPGAVLAKVDRLSMRFALEVRCPLLDVNLADWARRLPAAALNDGVTGKKILKRLALRYLPAEVVHRPKQGFGVPERAWSQARLLDLADALLTGPGCKLHAHLDARQLRGHLDRQRDPRVFDVFQVWELLVLEQWLRQASAPWSVPTRPEAPARESGGRIANPSYQHTARSASEGLL